MEERSQAFDVVKHITNELDKMLTEDGGHHPSGTKEIKWLEDVENCAQLLLDNEVFTHKGKRFYPGFERFQDTSLYIENIYVYQKKIQDLSSALDARQRCLDLRLATKKNTQGDK